MVDPRVSELLLQWQEAFDQGTELAEEELCRACPELLAEVRRRLSFLQGMQQLLEDSREPRFPGEDSSTAVTTTASSPAEKVPGPGVLRALRPKEQADELGRLGPFRILRLLGEGGAGVVFEAENLQRQRVALKVLKPMLAGDEVARRRFVREARHAAALRHDNIIAINEVGEDNGVPYISMPLLVGETLEARLRRTGPLPVPLLVDIARQVAAGLAAAHERNLVHRDIKPANIWLESAIGDRRSPIGQSPESRAPIADSEPPTADSRQPIAGGRVKILDFGLARSVVGDEPVTKQGTVLGTPHYMSPEQAAGNWHLDARSDLFSLGSVLYYMATGEVPFRGNRLMVVLDAVQRQQPKAPHDFNPDLPRALSDLIMGLLAKKAADRPPSALAVIEALQNLDGRRQEAGGGDLEPASRRRPWYWVAGVAGTGLLLLMWLWRNRLR